MTPSARRTATATILAGTPATLLLLHATTRPTLGIPLAVILAAWTWHTTRPGKERRG